VDEEKVVNMISPPEKFLKMKNPHLQT
jgi:hypothetical protein